MLTDGLILQARPVQCHVTKMSLHQTVASAGAQRFLPLLELSWDDILLPELLPLLSVEDVFRLRAVSRGHLALVTAYFARARRLDISAKRNISVDAIMVSEREGEREYTRWQCN